MNFEGFKKIASDKQTTTIAHPSGHMVKIVHGSLSPKMQAELSKVPHYADGGDVDEEQLAQPVAEIPTQAEVENPEQIDPATQQAMAQPSSGVTGSWDEPSSLQSGSELGAPALSQQGATHVAPSQGSASDVQGAVNEMKQGVRQEAAATSAQGRAESDALKAGIDKINAQQDIDQQKFKDLDEERQHFANDVMNGHIDPHRYIGSLSTPQKVGTAIGLILGGIGGGLTHQENPAMKFLNQQIENDINSQKEDLGKKENLLSANLRQFGNLKDAQQMTRANMNDLVAMEMKQKIAASQDPMAKARLQQELGKLDLQTAQLVAPLKAKQAVLQQMSNGQIDPAQVVSTLVPKEQQTKVFSEINQAQNASKSKDAYLKAFDQLAKDYRPATGGPSRYNIPLVTSPSEKVMGALEDPLIHDEVGRVNEFEKHDLASLRPQFGDSDETVKKKREGIESFFDHKQSAPTAKGFGIDLGKFQSTSTDPYAKLPPQQKKMADYARATGDKVMLRKLGLMQ